MSKTISALGCKDISDRLFLFIKDNIKTTQDLYHYVNNRLIPDNLLSELLLIIKVILTKQVTIKDNYMYPIRVSNYTFQISSNCICLYGTKIGLLDIKAINNSLENKLINKSISNQYCKVRKEPVIPQTQPTKPLKDIPYGTRQWFDAFYSDANWSINDIKLGID